MGGKNNSKGVASPESILITLRCMVTRLDFFVIYFLQWGIFSDFLCLRPFGGKTPPTKGPTLKGNILLKEQINTLKC